jgi:hypothetical protein
MKIRLLVSEFFCAEGRTDGRTDRLEANSRVLQICERVLKRQQLQ